MFQKDLLAGKSILVTGGGSGLGLAMAKKFAELGANVAICGRRAEKLEGAAHEISAFGTKVIPYQMDVRDYDAVGKMFEDLNREFGVLNGLVNNAAGNFLCLAEDLTPNGFKSVVDIVLMGTFNCSHHFGKNLIAKKEKGSALSIVTTYTETGCAFVLPSACAKAGVQALTLTLAYEWGPLGIRFNAIAPGPFPTEGAWSRLMPGDAFQKAYIDGNPMRRVGEPHELGNQAAYLLSDMAGFINGSVAVIDGGQRLQGAEFSQFAKAADRDQLRHIFAAMRGKEK